MKRFDKGIGILTEHSSLFHEVIHVLNGMNNKLGALDRMEDKLGGMDDKLGALDRMDDKLGGMDNKLGVLDDISEKLDTLPERIADALKKT